MASWIAIADDSDFSLHNLPCGVFSRADKSPRIGVAIGDYVLDMKSLAEEHVLDDLDFDVSVLEQKTLNAFAELGRKVTGRVRRRLQQLLDIKLPLASELRDNHERRKRCLLPLDSITMHLPVAVSDYTDFFIGLHHAQNSADFLKKGSDITQLMPYFWEAPAAYHGRASSVVVSGTPVHRPKGQIRANGQAKAGLSQQLDFEVEFAAVIGTGSELGSAIDVDQADTHIFGFVLLNDWSARDFQKNEIAPFASKNFATSISPWIVPFEALESFRVPPTGAGRPLPDYLAQKITNSVYDLPIRATLEVSSQKYQMSHCNTKHAIFSFAQMIAHHTGGGCPLRPGNLLATGTMSGPTRPEQGCFLELSKVGTEAYEMTATDLSQRKLIRTFLDDGDTVEITCHLRSSDGSGNVGFGACRGQVLPGN
ncbi:hypothetical protein LTR27_011632 [Elasticomyces elasticus]|nr:hypothetical protein LTR27_011632 [Elasticomyces elasticus]